MCSIQCFLSSAVMQKPCKKAPLTIRDAALGVCSNVHNEEWVLHILPCEPQEHSTGRCQKITDKQTPLRNGWNAIFLQLSPVVLYPVCVGSRPATPSTRPCILTDPIRHTIGAELPCRCRAHRTYNVCSCCLKAVPHVTLCSVSCSTNLSLHDMNLRYSKQNLTPSLSSVIHRTCHGTQGCANHFSCGNQCIALQPTKAPLHAAPALHLHEEPCP